MEKLPKEPGTYLINMRNGKAVSLTDRGVLSSWGDFLDDVSSTSPSAATLAAQVGWVFVALNKRSQGLLEIDQTWRRNEEDVSMLPFVFRDNGPVSWSFMAQKLDRAMQLHDEAYLLKQRSGDRLIGLRFLDPSSVTPDTDSANVTDGVTIYKYMTNDGEKDIPREDLIIFPNVGTREMLAGTAAGYATRLAAEIMRGLGETADTTFDNNAMPFIIAMVPAGTDEGEQDRVESRLKRIFNRGERTRERPVAGLRKGTEIETIGVNPDDMAMKELSDLAIEEILAAHDVPESIARSNAATYATAINDGRAFITVLGARLGYFAEILNDDKDVNGFGIELVVNVNEHPTQKQDEVAMSLAFTRLLVGMYPDAAGYLLGIKEEDFPEEYQGRVFLPVQVVQEVQEPTTDGDVDTSGVNVDTEPETEETEDRKAVELVRCRRYYRRAKHSRPFESDILTIDQIAEIADDAGHKTAKRETYESIFNWRE